MDSETLPDELTLGPSRFRWMGAAIVSFALLVIGGLLVNTDFLLATILIVFFGSCFVVSLAQLSRKGSRLHLRKDGFDQVLLGKEVSFNWHEVSEFGVWGKEHGFAKDEFVSFEYLGKDGIGQAPATAGDGHSTLGDTFGKDALELAALMNAFRARAMRIRG